jgi:hypothetical protein
MKKTVVNRSQLILEYYQLPFRQIMSEFGSAIERALTTDREAVRQRYWRQYSGAYTATDEAWGIVKAYADYIESEMAGVIKRHSVFFWIHLYRRIGVSLFPHLPSKTDATTTVLVRHIMECAFLKYGSLTNCEDVRDASKVEQCAVLGGWYKKSLDVLKKEAGGKLPEEYFRLPSQLVLVQFDENDFIDVFRLEGLAYEYWRATAKLRAIGKGVPIRVTDGDVFEERTDAVAELIARHDARTEHSPFISSLVGVSFADLSPKRHTLSHVITPIHNAERVPYQRFAPDGQTYPKDFVTNFLLPQFRLEPFVKAHEFASTEFREKHGFGFEELCFFLAAASYVPLVEGFAQEDVSRQLEMTMLRLCQRAYYARPNRSDAVVDRILEIVELLGGVDEVPFGRNLKTEARAIFDHLTLSAEKQAAVSLWSHGPRSIFVPYGDHLVVDLQGIQSILNTMFFGVRYDQTSRGVLFEEGFRKLARDRHINVLPERELVGASGEMRETDAAIRLGDDLFLCDCRSIWMPLDYEIGRPRTLAKRREFLEDKLEQLRSIEQFVQANPRGRNYDFSWAKRITAIGISPFVEWTWDLDDFYWFDKRENVPRIMAVAEALEIFAPAQPSTTVAAGKVKQQARRTNKDALRKKKKTERLRRTLGRRQKKHF